MLTDVFGQSSLHINRPFKRNDDWNPEVAKQAGKVLEVALQIRSSAKRQLGLKEVLDINEDGRAMIDTYTLHHERWLHRAESYGRISAVNATRTSASTSE